MKMFSSVALLLILCCADAGATVIVYMKDSAEIEAQAAWCQGDTVYVQVQPELQLEFARAEVDLAKSKLPDRQRGVAPAVAPPAPVPAPSPAPAVQPAGPRGYGELLDDLVVISGIKRDLKDYFGRSELGEVNRIFADAVSVDYADRTMKKHLARKLSQHNVEEVLRWYGGPVGKRLVEAESVIVYNKKANVKNYVSLGKGADFRERMGLIGQIEKTLGAGAREERFMKYMIDRMTKAIPATHPEAVQLKERIKGELFEPGGFREHFIDTWAYTYRYLSLDELRDYLQFLRSANGKKFTAAMVDANEEIFRKVAAKIVDYMVEELAL